MGVGQSSGVGLGSVQGFSDFDASRPGLMSESNALADMVSSLPEVKASVGEVAKLLRYAQGLKICLRSGEAKHLSKLQLKQEHIDAGVSVDIVPCREWGQHRIFLNFSKKDNPPMYNPVRQEYISDLELGSGVYKKAMRGFDLDNFRYVTCLKAHGSSSGLQSEVDIQNHIAMQTGKESWLFTSYQKVGKDKQAIKKEKYYSSELGVDLDNYLSQQNHAKADIYTIVAQLTTLVRDLHSYKIAHNDLKPDNILVCKDRSQEGIECSLIDFGLSYDSRVRKHTFIGNHMYLPPQHLYNYYARKGKYDRSSFSNFIERDLGGLELILYQLLQGEYHPFARCNDENYKSLHKRRKVSRTFHISRSARIARIDAKIEAEIANANAKKAQIIENLQKRQDNSKAQLVLEILKLTTADKDFDAIIKQAGVLSVEETLKSL